MTRLAAPRRALRGGRVAAHPGSVRGHQPSATPAPSIFRLKSPGSIARRHGGQGAGPGRHWCPGATRRLSVHCRAEARGRHRRSPAPVSAFARAPGSSRTARPRARTALAGLALRTAGRRAVNRADGSGHRAWPGRSSIGADPWPSVMEGRILRDPSDVHDEDMLKIELARHSTRVRVDQRSCRGGQRWRDAEG